MQYAILMWFLWAVFMVVFVLAIRHGIKQGYTFSDMLLGFVIQMFIPPAIVIAGFLHLLKVQVSMEVNYGMFLFFVLEGNIGTLIAAILLSFAYALF